MEDDKAYQANKLRDNMCGCNDDDKVMGSIIRHFLQFVKNFLLSNKTYKYFPTSVWVPFLKIYVN
jgi:hypothetical protein